MKHTAIRFFVLALLLSAFAFVCTGCDSLTNAEVEDILTQIDVLTGAETDTVAAAISDPVSAPADPVISKEEYYYDLSNVVLYIDTYDCLPENYITKAEAKALGWSGGSVESYKEGAAIGGDTFGNFEKLLPTGISYTECDLDTNGADSRGACRLVFGKENNEYRYYYTADHYSSFSEVYINENGEVTYR